MKKELILFLALCSGVLSAMNRDRQVAQQPSPEPVQIGFNKKIDSSVQQLINQFSGFLKHGRFNDDLIDEARRQLGGYESENYQVFIFLVLVASIRSRSVTAVEFALTYVDKTRYFGWYTAEGRLLLHEALWCSGNMQRRVVLLMKKLYDLCGRSQENGLHVLALQLQARTRTAEPMTASYLAHDFASLDSDQSYAILKETVASVGGLQQAIHSYEQELLAKRKQLVQRAGEAAQAQEPATEAFQILTPDDKVLFVCDTTNHDYQVLNYFIQFFSPANTQLRAQLKGKTDFDIDGLMQKIQTFGGSSDYWLFTALILAVEHKDACAVSYILENIDNADFYTWRTADGKTALAHVQGISSEMGMKLGEKIKKREDRCRARAPRSAGLEELA